MRGGRTRRTKYRRVLLKLSGETLQDRSRGLSLAPDTVAGLARRIGSVARTGVQVGIVVGGGNIFRGARPEAGETERIAGDYMGMLATVINSVALQSAMEQQGIKSRVLTAIEMGKVAEPFSQRLALRSFDRGEVVLFAAGTGNPFFSTDTAAALRACEIGADVLLKATKVDGVYAKDPALHPGAERLERLTYDDALRRSLKIMDAAAFSLCREHRIPIVVFNFFEAGSLEKAVKGVRVGTLVSE